MLAVQLGEDRGDLGPEHPQQRQVERLQHGDRAAGSRAAAVTSRPIQPPPMTTTEPPSPKRLLEPLAVLDGAQVGHRGAGVVGGREVARGRPGRQQQPVVGLLAVAGVHGVRREVDRGDGGAQPQVDVVLVVPVGVVHEGGLELVGAEQVALGQRGPLVGQVVLVAEHHHRALEPGVAEPLDGLGRRQSRAHHDERLGHESSRLSVQSRPSLRPIGVRRDAAARRVARAARPHLEQPVVAATGTQSRPARRTVRSTESLSGCARQTIVENPRRLASTRQVAGQPGADAGALVGVLDDQADLDARRGRAGRRRRGPTTSLALLGDDAPAAGRGDEPLDRAAVARRGPARGSAGGGCQASTGRCIATSAATSWVVACLVLTRVVVMGPGSFLHGCPTSLARQGFATATAVFRGHEVRCDLAHTDDPG